MVKSLIIAIFFFFLLSVVNSLCNRSKVYGIIESEQMGQGIQEWTK